MTLLVLLRPHAATVTVVIPDAQRLSSAITSHATETRFAGAPRSNRLPSNARVAWR